MKILELTLQSTNIDAQERLFQQTLGFQCKRTSPTKLVVRCGSNILNFHAANRQYYYHYCFLIPPESLESAVEFLDKRNFKALLHKQKRIVNFGNGRSVYFLDADGNLAEFIERPTLKHPSKVNFAISDVIRLNEIGMPSDNPKESTREMIEAYGIELIDGGVNRDDFVWCGDYEGVFLIPKIGRDWLPLEKPAEKNQLEVRFETQAGQFRHVITS